MHGKLWVGIYFQYFRKMTTNKLAPNPTCHAILCVDVSRTVICDFCFSDGGQNRPMQALSGNAIMKHDRLEQVDIVALFILWDKSYFAANIFFFHKNAKYKMILSYLCWDTRITFVGKTVQMPKRKTEMNAPHEENAILYCIC